MSAQLDLFDAASGRALHRATDPETSTEAAAGVAVYLTAIQQELFEHAATLSAFTAREIAESIVRAGGAKDVETYRKRVREIQKKGVFVECDSRPCNITKKNAQTFKRKAAR